MFVKRFHGFSVGVKAAAVGFNAKHLVGSHAGYLGFDIEGDLVGVHEGHFVRTVGGFKVCAVLGLVVGLKVGFRIEFSVRCVHSWVLRLIISVLVRPM